MTANALTRRRFLSLAVTAGAVSVLAACQSPSPAAPTSAPAAPPAPTSAAGAPAPTTAPAATAVTATLVVAPYDELISLDPVNTAGRGIVDLNLLYDTLIVQGSDGKYYPGLADSWEASSDAKTFTFKLKQGVKFHDGTPFNASAVQFNFDRLANPGAKGSAYVSLVGIYDHTEVVDDYTAKVVLKQPFAPFYSAVAYVWAGQASPTAVQKFGQDFDTNPVGTGPFSFVEWVPKSQATYTRNPDYNWGSSRFKHTGPALVKTVTLPLIPDPETRLATLEKGEVHMAQDVDPASVDRVSNNSDLVLVKVVPTGLSTTYQFNTERAPVDDVKVRQALAYAADPDEIVNVVFKNAFAASRTLLQPGTIGYDPTGPNAYPTDRTKANALLDQAGWTMGSDGIRTKDGKKLEIIFDLIGTSIQTLPTKVAEVIQAQCRQVGIQISIKQYDTAGLFAAMQAGNQMTIWGRGQAPDPDTMRTQFHSSYIGKSTSQRTRFKDPQIDKLLDDGAQTIDPAKRADIYEQLSTTIMSNMLVLPHYYHQVLWGTRKTVKDLATDAMGNPQMYDVTVG
jgi:peptide/nickel transport system substrate-binding protein